MHTESQRLSKKKHVKYSIGSFMLNDCWNNNILILFLLDSAILYSSQFFLYQKNKGPPFFFPSGPFPTEFTNPECIYSIECHIVFLFSIIINHILSTSSFYINKVSENKGEWLIASSTEASRRNEENDSESA